VCNEAESNRFTNESQNLWGDIFMARSANLVYSILLITIPRQDSAARDPKSLKGGVFSLSEVYFYTVF